MMSMYVCCALVPRNFSLRCRNISRSVRPHGKNAWGGACPSPGRQPEWKLLANGANVLGVANEKSSFAESPGRPAERPSSQEDHER